MTDSTHDLIYRILTKYLGEDEAKKAAADLEKLNLNAGDLGKTLDETGDKTIEFGKRGREMYLLFGELNRVVPGLGDALRGLNLLGFNPLIATLSLVAFGFYEAKKAIDSWNKSEDGAANAAAEPTFLAGIQAKIKVLDDATTAAENYAKKEKDVFSGEQSITEQLKNQLTYLAAIEAAHGEQTNAQKALALAKISQAETEGEITPSQAISQRAGVEREYTSIEADRKWREADAKLQAQAQALAAVKGQQPALDAQWEAAHKAATEAAAKHEQATKDVENFNTPEKQAKFLEPFQSAIAEAQKQVDAASANIRATAIPGIYTKPSQIQQAALDKANLQLANANKALQGAHAHMEQLEREAGAPGENAAKAAAGKEADAKQKSDENEQAIKSLQAEVDSLRQQLSATGPLGQQTEATKQQTITTQETTELERQAKTDVEKYRRTASKGDLAGALATLKDLNDALAGHAEVLEYVKGLGVNVNKIQSVIAELKKEMAQNHSQARSFLTP